jgi:hypothetical protein
MAEASKAEFDLNEWAARFRGVVNSDGHAARSWEALRNAGVDPDQICNLFAFACDVDNSPVFRLIEELRSHSLREVKSALRLAARLDSDREVLNSYRSDLPEGLPEKIEEGANRLRDSALEVRKMFSRHKMNTTFFLAWLINFIQERTGTPHYKDVSILLECAHVAYGREMPIIGEEAVRKAYTRFMQDSPFRGLLTPESKKNFLIAAAIFVAIQFLQSGQVPKPSSPPQSTDTTSSDESLMNSLDEIFRKQSDSSES